MNFYPKASKRHNNAPTTTPGPQITPTLLINNIVGTIIKVYDTHIQGQSGPIYSLTSILLWKNFGERIRF
jgi:hypothetical protein